MVKRLKEYLWFLEVGLPNVPVEDLPELWQQHLARVQQFQHERLVHLLVTLFFGAVVAVLFIFFLMMEGFYYVGWDMSATLMLLFAIGLLVLEVFYIRHYYFLENGVQKLYNYNFAFFRKE